MRFNSNAASRGASNNRNDSARSNHNDHNSWSEKVDDLFVRRC